MGSPRVVATTKGHRPPANPVVLVLAAVVSVQFGGALAATLLPTIGVIGSVALRLAFAAAILMAIVRPKLLGRTSSDWATVTAFAVALTVMNLAFYASLLRLPIGVAVTIEFLGPLTLAAALSRKARDLAAVGAALLGVVLISEIFSTSWSEIDFVGILYALLAGACWAGYIVLSGKTGQRFGGLDGIAICLVLGSIVLVPISVFTAGAQLLEGEVLLRGLGIALLSSAIPYSLELLALRSLKPGVFGVLLSLEPAAAALAGLIILGQTLDLIQLGGMALVVMASILIMGRRGPAATTNPLDESAGPGATGP
ncbi:EamA family transporter [Ornithinimicrobium sp. Arc0846-15]|nr:EamA family transporter [Ornithinimicrobium laminariae]